MKEDHSPGHEIVSMKNMVPELLRAHNGKQQYMNLLKDLLLFISDECSDEQSLQSFGGVDELSILNIVEATKVLISDMRKRSYQENKKIK